VYVHAVHVAFCEATLVVPEDRLPTLLEDVVCREDDLALEQDARVAAGEVAHRLAAAAELLRTFPSNQGPAGISRLVVMVLDLLHNVRTATP